MEQAQEKKEEIKHANKVQYFIAIVLCLAAVVLMIMGFYAPPQGEIHPSALVAAGELLTFASAILGLEAHYKSVIIRLLKNKQD